MDTESWGDLVAALDGWGSASAVAPDRIAVTRPDGKPVTVVMSPGEYDDMLGVMGLSPEQGVQHAIRVLLRLRPGHRYAVYRQYRLEGSKRDTLPGSSDHVPHLPSD